jgi:hypothetical protein
MDKKMLGQLATKQDLGKLVTQEEFTGFKNENLSRLDDILVIVRRLDQERIFSTERVNRIEDEVRTLRQEVSRSIGL